MVVGSKLEECMRAVVHVLQQKSSGAAVEQEL